MDCGDDFNDFVLNELIYSSSSDDEDNFIYDAAKIIVEEAFNEPLYRGSIVGHGTVDRDRYSWHFMLYRDYFADNPVYGPDNFRRRLVYYFNYTW